MIVTELPSNEARSSDFFSLLSISPDNFIIKLKCSTVESHQGWLLQCAFDWLKGPK